MTTKPLYLFADSQLLFWKEGDRWFSDRIREDMDPSMTGAAYIGASNGDDPNFYELFRSAMEVIEISECRMIPARPSKADLDFLDAAGLVLLSGGNTHDGWRTIQENGVKDRLLRKRYDGAVTVGISAGAVQLGLGALSDSAQPQHVDMFGFVPFYIGAHEENEDWWNLRALVHMSQTDVRGVGIPTGGGLLYHPDGTLEPVRKTSVEISKQDGQIHEHLMLPLSPEL